MCVRRAQPRSREGAQEPCVAPFYTPDQNKRYASTKSAVNLHNVGNSVCFGFEAMTSASLIYLGQRADEGCGMQNNSLCIK